MARWEPNGGERLVGAAIELFAEQGYDATTVAQIAERAGLTKSTFFRHFTDKRDVLFSGQELLLELFVGAIAATPADATPLEAVGAALEAVAEAFPPERRSFGYQRSLVVAAHSELQEREALKRVYLTDAMVDALHARGVPDPAAGLAAQLGALAFGTTFAAWVDPANEEPFGPIARRTLAELHAASAALS